MSNKTKIFFFVIIFSGVFVWAESSLADTHTMADCNSAAWDTAYSAASSGDTITFPAEACSVSMSKALAKTNLVIQGSGTDTTTVTGGFTCSGSSCNGLRITAIKFITGPALDISFNGAQAIQDIRVDHNIFFDMDLATSFGSLESTSGAVPTDIVVDHNIYDTITAEGNYVFGDCDDTSSFPFALGTATGAYYEDNIIQNSESMGHFIASRCSGRYVIRYNTFNGLVAWDPIDAHDSYEGGGRSNAKRGTWTTEIYNNLFSYAASDKRIIHLRGGQHVVWGNLISSPQDYAIVLTSYNINEGTCNYGDVVCSDGRYNDQINHTYVWGNKDNCGSLAGCDIHDIGTCCAAGSTESPAINCEALTLNVDYYATAMPDYTPYTYPHPLAAEDEELDTTAPAAPSGLSVQ